jgi:hypothetical protein
LGSVFPFPGEFEGLLGWACCVDCSADAQGEGAESQIGRVWGGWERGLEVVGLVWEMVKIGDEAFWCMTVMNALFDVCWLGVWVAFLSAWKRFFSHCSYF